MPSKSTRITQKVKMSTKRQPVQVREETVLRMRNFSEKTGISMTFIVEQALSNWLALQESGEGQLQKYIASQGGAAALRKKLKAAKIKGFMTQPGD